MLFEHPVELMKRSLDTGPFEFDRETCSAIADYLEEACDQSKFALWRCCKVHAYSFRSLRLWQCWIEDATEIELPTPTLSSVRIRIRKSPIALSFGTHSLSSLVFLLM
jgi:hypothetical protein